MAALAPAILPSLGVGAATTAAISSALPWVAGGLQVLGGLKQSQAEQASYKAQAAAADANARITEQNTKAELEKTDRERRLRLGANIASQGASGITGGSALDIISDNVSQETLNLLTIESQGKFAQNQYLSQAQNLRTQAKASKAAGILSSVNSGITSYAALK